MCVEISLKEIQKLLIEMFADKQTIAENKEVPFVFPTHLRHAVISIVSRL